MAPDGTAGGIGKTGSMVGLAHATEVTMDDAGSHDVGATRRGRAELSAKWEIWGPQGGYLASVALRAAGIATGRARPASINAHFTGAGASAPVDVHTEINRTTRVATSATVRITQSSERGDLLLMTATVWGVDADLPGLEHQTQDQPLAAAGPHHLPDLETLMAGRDRPPPHPFWENVEQRPVHFVDDWDARTAGDARNQCWYRFAEGETHADRWLDACRSLVVLDVESWAATVRAHVGVLEYFAPTIEVTARFVGDTGRDAWLFSDARAPVATGGLVAHAGEIWTEDGRLVTTGGSTLLCRPAARRPDGR